MSSKKKKKINIKTKKVRKHKSKIIQGFNFDHYLALNTRQIFLYETITNKTAERVVQQLLTLDNMNKTPIIMYINSPGGSVDDGFSIIDTMKSISTPVITFINGGAYSMAGLISISGEKRIMTLNSIWMGHEMRGGFTGGDYISKSRDRMKFVDLLWNNITEHLKKYTKLSIKDLSKLQTGELWLTPQECKNKGIVDHIT